MSQKVKTDPRFNGIYQKLIDWRKSRGNRREAIPNHLFDAAAILLDKHPPSQVASALGINSSRFKQHLGLPLQKKKLKPVAKSNQKNDSIQVIEVQQVRMPPSDLPPVLASLSCPGGITLNLYKLEAAMLAELLASLGGVA